MTPIAWALLGIVWGMLASILTHKWLKLNKTIKFPVDDAFVVFACWVLLPATLIGIIIVQTFIKDWK